MATIDCKSGNPAEYCLPTWFEEFAIQGILLTDGDLTIRTWNRWLEDHSGRASGEMIGRQLFEAFPDLVERHLDQQYQEALAGETAVLASPLSGFLLPLLSTTKWSGYPHMRQAVRIAPLRQEGRIVGTITLIQDMTEQALREEELQVQIAELAATIADREHAEVALRERNCLLTLVADVGAAQSQGKSLDDTLQKCAQAAVRNLGVAFARIWTLNQEEDVLELKASAGMYTHGRRPRTSAGGQAQDRAHRARAHAAHHQPGRRRPARQ